MDRLFSSATVRDSLRGCGLRLQGIDSHTHVWSANCFPAVISAAAKARPDLQRDFLPRMMLERAEANFMQHLIFVQARDPSDGAFEEATEMSRAFVEYKNVAGFIAGFNLCDAKKSARELEKLSKLPGICGVRMIEPENSGLGIYSSADALTACLSAAAHGLTVDILIRSANPGQLREMELFLEKLGKNGDTRIVIDHLAKPLGVTSGTLDAEWKTVMKSLGNSKRFFIKLSALRGEAGADADRTQFFPFYDYVLETFGEDRLLFGSDHPVSFDYAACVLDVSEWLRLGAILKSVALKNSIKKDQEISPRAIYPKRVVAISEQNPAELESAAHAFGDDSDKAERRIRENFVPGIADKIFHLNAISAYALNLRVGLNS